MAVDKRVADIDDPLGHVTKYLLAVAELAGGEEPDLDVDTGIFDLLDRLLQHQGGIVTDRMLSGEPQLWSPRNGRQVASPIPPCSLGELIAG